MAFNKKLHDYIYHPIHEFKEGTVFQATHKELPWLVGTFKIFREGIDLKLGYIEVELDSSNEGKVINKEVNTGEFKNNFRNVIKVIEGKGYILDDQLAVIEEPWNLRIKFYDGETEKYLGLKKLKDLGYSKESILNNIEKLKELLSQTPSL